MNAKDLFGKQVIDVNAKVLGTVVDIELDIEESTITGILIKTGWTKKVSISPKNIDRIGDKILLKVAKDKRKKA